MMKSLTELDKQYIWHPFTKQNSPIPIIPIVKGAGTLLIDEAGKSYIDAISSWWVTIHGHSHPYIAERVFKQASTLEQVIFGGFTHPPAVELASRLIPLLPGDFSRVFYSDNGSTATEVAIKMAVQYWWNLQNDSVKPRKKLLAFHNSYHGDTFGAMSVSERSVFTQAFKDLLLEVEFIDVPDANNLPALLEYIAQQGSSIAAIIYEPLVQGAGGINMYQPEHLNVLLQACKEQGIIRIADEVMTGFGRTGKLFASEYMEEKPDIICLSKGLTAGTMALSITACSDKIYQAFVSDDAYKTFFHGHSFTANPIACTAACANLDLFERNNTMFAVQALEKQHHAFATKLLPYQEKGQIKNIRIRGTILAFEIISANGDNYLNEIGPKFTAMALEKGVYLRPLGNTAYIMPPYCITAEELQKVYATITEILDSW